MTKIRIHLHLTAEAYQLLDRAVAKRGASRAAVVDAAIKQFLNEDLDERQLVLVARRIEDLATAMRKLSNDATAQSETLAAFIQFYFGVTPLPQDGERLGASAVAKKRFDWFIDQVASRLNGRERLVNALMRPPAPTDPSTRKMENAA
jgi:hypothetical protein